MRQAFWNETAPKPVHGKHSRTYSKRTVCNPQRTTAPARLAASPRLGASELIDLVIRSAKPGRWRPGPQRTQYKEYARSALAAGFNTAPPGDRSATLLCMVNPTNPTGEYWNIKEMKQFIETNCDRGTTVIIGKEIDRPLHLESLSLLVLSGNPKRHTDKL